MYKKLIHMYLVCAAGTVLADTITVRNMSGFDLHAAVYYFKKTADRVGDTKLIAAGAAQTFERPSMRLPIVGADRELVFSINKNDLKQKLTSSEFHILPHVGVGLGRSFYLSLDKGIFTGHNEVEWRVVAPLKKRLLGVAASIDELTLGQVRRKFQTHPFFKIPVIVRESTALPAEEHAFISARLPKIKVALEKLLDRKLADNEVPSIAFCASGGGYRAMLGALGSLQGAESTHLLDVALYMSALSGSTWTLGPWIQSGWSLAEFRRRLIQKLKKDFIAIPPDPKDITANLIKRLSFKQPITATNIYGRMLAHHLLSDLPGGPFNLYLHDQAARMKTGDSIFPIYTAVTTKLPYRWIEFTPFEVGSDYLGGYIPIWAFGSPFSQGKMRYFTPPYALSFILAICGSAFAARLSEVVANFERKIGFTPVKKALRVGAEELAVGKYRISAAEVFNWTYGMGSLPRSQQEILKVIDGGIAYNLGLEAVLRRKPNIIIIMDYSASPTVGNQLKKAEANLRSRGFALPPIDYTDLEKKTYAIFKDPTNKNAPVIIYIPQVVNPNYPGVDPRACLENWCGTFEFKYAPENATRLIDHAAQGMKDAAPAIINEITQWIDDRKK